MKDLIKANFHNELSKLLNTYHKENLNERDVDLAHTPSRILYELINSYTGSLLLGSKEYASEDEINDTIEISGSIASELSKTFMKDFVALIDSKGVEYPKSTEQMSIPMIISMLISSILTHSITVEEECYCKE